MHHPPRNVTKISRAGAHWVSPAFAIYSGCIGNVYRQMFGFVLRKNVALVLGATLLLATRSDASVGADGGHAR